MNLGIKDQVILITGTGDLRGVRQDVKPNNVRTGMTAPGVIALGIPCSASSADELRSVGVFYQASAILIDAFVRAVAFATSGPDDVDMNEILFRLATCDL